MNILIISKKIWPNKQKSTSTLIKTLNFTNLLRAISIHNSNRLILISLQLVIRLLINIYSPIRMHVLQSWE